MKYMKLIIMFLITMLFCACSFGLGIKYVESKYESETEYYVTQNLIAVVNTDEGMIVNNSKVNYGADLLSFPDVNFISTSLTDARDGVSQGRYAAYVIIPNNFSLAVSSINGKPEKANIQYEIGSNLRDDIKEEVVWDIQEFVTTLRANISYVYVNSIMGEFHTAQDGAKTVLNNDVIELEQVNAIKTEDLIYPFEYPEWERIEWELEDIDLIQYYNELDESVAKLGNDYEAYLAEGAMAFNEVSQKRDAVENDVLVLMDTIDSINVAYGVSDNTVYDNGMMHLREYESNSTKQLKEQKNEIEEIITGNGNLSNGSMWEIRDSISSNCIAIRDVYEEIAEKEISVSWNSINGEKVTDQDAANEQYIVIERNTYERLYQAVQSIENTPEELNATSDILLEIVNGINTDHNSEVQNIIDNEIVKPLKDHIAAESERMKNAENVANEQINSFMNELELYDPLEYVNEEEIDRNLSTIWENMGKMETTIDEKNLEYFEFVTDVYDISDENYEELLDRVELTNEQTATNINLTVDAAKESRQKKNEINTALLDDFSQKLAYTRIGNQENEAINEFIVSPLEISDVNSIHNAAVKNQNKERIWIIGIGIFFGVAFLLLISRILYLYITNEERRGKYETGL